jgi:flagellar protein FlaF
MQSAAQAYGNTARQISSPRELEAGLLLQAASRLQAVQESWEGRQIELNGALLYNRKLWSIFLTSITDQGNPLPREIRQNLANLGIFVLKQTLNLMINPEPDAIKPLININREIAAGLLAKA